MTRGTSFFVSAKDNKQVASYMQSVKASEKAQYVTSRKDGSWSVKRGSATRPSRVFDTQKDAISYAKTVASSQKSDVLIFEKGNVAYG